MPPPGADRHIFHIARADDWEAARTSGLYRVSTLGRSLDEEGFIHCSLRHQVAPVANAVYRGTRGLVVLVVDVDRVTSEVRYETPRGADGPPGADGPFPHVYGPVEVDAVVAVEPFAPGADGLFRF